MSSQFHRMSWATHCLMAALFQPSPSLRRLVDAEQLKLLGSLDRPFVAVHLRMGHLEGEKQDLARCASLLSLALFLSGTPCCTGEDEPTVPVGSSSPRKTLLSGVSV